jgi:hypothetical protein
VQRNIYSVVPYGEGSSLIWRWNDLVQRRNIDTVVPVVDLNTLIWKRNIDAVVPVVEGNNLIWRRNSNTIIPVISRRILVIDGSNFIWIRHINTVAPGSISYIKSDRFPARS